MDALHRSQYELIFKLIYGLAHQPKPELPEGITYEEALKAVQDFAEKTLLKEQLDKIPPPWDREKLLTANIYLLRSFSQDQVPSVPQDLAAKLADLEKFEANQAKVNAAHVAQKPTTHEQVQAALKQMAANLETQSPETAQAVIILEQTLAQSISLNPSQELPNIVAYVRSTTQALGKPLTDAQVVQVVAPVIPGAITENVILQSYHLTVESELLLHLPPRVASQLATQAVALKLSRPDVPPTRISEFLALQAEAYSGVVFPEPSQLIDKLTKFNFEAKGREALTQAFISQGMPVEVANQFSQPQIITTVAHLSSYVPQSVTESRTTKEAKQLGVVKGLNTAAAKFLEKTNVGSFSRQLEQIRSWKVIYLAYQNYQQDFPVSTGPEFYSGPGSNPFLEFVTSQSQQYLQSLVEDKLVQPVIQETLAKFGSTALGQSLGMGTKTAVATAESAAIKQGAKAAGAAGLEATITGALAALGIADPEPITKTIMLAIDAIILFGKKIWNVIKQKFQDWVVPLAAGATLGLLSLASGAGVAFASIAGVGTAVGMRVSGVKLGNLTSSGPSSAIQNLGNFANGIFSGVTGLAITEIAVPVIVIIASIPPTIAILLFIINSSAYISPPSQGGSFGPGGQPYTGPLPEGCPQAWPLDNSYITQGAWVPRSINPGNYHYNTEALDMHAGVGTPVKATHPGVVINKIGVGASFGFGNYVDLLSTCVYNGVELKVLSRYAHLNSFALADNTLVQAGDVIAYSGGSGGYQNAPHLHYEFRRNDVAFSHTHYEEDIAPFMWPNFIPKEVPRQCVFFNSLNNTCNTQIP